jgi:Ras-related protein Rab-2A
MYSHLFKYIIVGDTGCGKSCVLLRFMDHRFIPTHELTIGIEFGCKVITVPSTDTKVKLQIWDTAGQESFKSITRSYYRGAAVSLVVYDITRYHTFKRVETWLQEIKEINDYNTLLVIIGNKSDLEHRRQVPREVGEEMAEKYNCGFYECSAKNDINIQEIFENTAKKVYDKVRDERFDAGVKFKGITLNRNYRQTVKDTEEPGICLPRCY